MNVNFIELPTNLREQREQKINSETSLKRKTKCEELENLKRCKTDLQNTIDNFRKSFESETLPQNW